MKKFMVFLLLASAILPLRAVAAAPSDDAGWAKVQQLKVGTKIRIKTNAASINCGFKSATSDGLVCGGKADVSLQRSEIKSVGMSHRVRSAVVGFAIGAGGGAAGGAAAGKTGGFIGKGALAAIFAVPFAIIGGFIGAATDFTHSTIYRSH